MSLQIQINHCVACGGKRVSSKHKGNYTGTAAEASRYFLSGREATAYGDIWGCDSCGFEFTSPQFAPHDYAGIYANAKLAPAGVNLRPAYRKRFEGLASWINREGVTAKRHLDFGCGDGQMLEVVSGKVSVGFDVVPPEVRWDKASYAFGFLPEMVGQAPLEKQSFDLITAIDVLEHLPHLDEHFSALAQLLSSDGRLVLSVPDPTTLTAKLMGAKWSMYLLEHLWYFTPQSITHFAERHGLILQAQADVKYYTPIAHLLNRLLSVNAGSGESQQAKKGFTDTLIRVPAAIRIFQLVKTK